VPSARIWLTIAFANVLLPSPFGPYLIFSAPSAILIVASSMLLQFDILMVNTATIVPYETARIFSGSIACGANE
jgi:hypothetical protein